MHYFLLVFFAALPSLIWLFYYLKSDKNPEPKNLLLYVFLAGSLFAVTGYLFQKISFLELSYLSQIIHLSPLVIFIIQSFLIVAFSEELLKYLAFFFTVRGDVEVDEPIDFIIYMITAGLGFAAMENFLILFSFKGEFLQIIEISVIRFLSGTLLHALVSGILGGFLMYSHRFNKKSIIFLGLIFVSLLHGVYNIIAEEIATSFFLFLFILLLVSLSLTLSLFIGRAKKMKSICFN